MSEDDLRRTLLTSIRPLPSPESGELRSVADYARLVRKASWRQAWNADARALGEVRGVRGSLYSDAIERCLGENSSVYIPRTSEPVYLDRPILLRSGNRLVVHPETEIRLIVGKVGTCLVRNAGIVFAPDRPVALCEGADTGILIEGGIWSDQQNEGRGRGGAFDAECAMSGAHGMFLLHSISGVTVRNVRFRDCSAFAIQLGNATDFVVENVRFDECADGIHIEGPSERGIIRHIAGKTNDDAVALNAWDWDTCSLTFGPITDLLVEDIELKPGYTWSELRLLAGTKVYPGGEKVDCDIRRCIFRNIRGVHTFKMYDQPNITKPDKDFADPIGKMADLFFSDLRVDGIRKGDYYDTSSDGVFDICSDIDGLSIRNVRFNYIPGEDDMVPYLVSIGPKSLTRVKDGATSEIFNPSASPVASGVRIEGVFLPAAGDAGARAPFEAVGALLHERHLPIDTGDPRSPPRGGTGRGRIIGMGFGDSNQEVDSPGRI